VLAGLYTLYMFALLPAAQFLWILIARRQRLKAWLLTLLAVALLYLPWALYAGPKLLNYVAYKVVKDNDQPLSLFIYLGRHLSAFLVGHLEGPLAPLWPWALLLLIPPLAALALSKSNGSGWKRFASPAAYLTLILLTALAVGFIQQLRAPFIPERFERVLLFAAPALWLLLALGTRELWRESRPAAGIFLMSRYVPRSRLARSMFLRTEQSGYHSTSEDLTPLLGKEGVALTLLRPSGKALIDGRRIDVVTEGALVEKGSPVRVMDVEGARVVVRKIAV
jgi:hypothetical protein